MAVEPYEVSQASHTATLDRVTLARNTVTGASGGGLYAFRAAVLVTGSIVAANTGQGVLRRAIAQPSDCGGTLPQDGRGNLAGTANCGFAGDAADARLGSDLIDAGGQTPLLTVASDSPAVDSGRTVSPPISATSHARRGRVRRRRLRGGRARDRRRARPERRATRPPAFAFSSPKSPARVRVPARRAGGAGSWEACVSPLTYPALAPGGTRSCARRGGDSRG